MAVELGRAVAHLPHITWGQAELGPGSGARFDAGEPVPCPTAGEPHRALPPPRPRFDLAISTLVLHHAASVADFFLGVKEVLVPGGYFFVLEFRPVGEDLSVRLHLEEDCECVPVPITEDKILEDKEFWETRTPEQVMRLFVKDGFDRVGWRKATSIPAWSFAGVVDGEEGVPTMIVWGRRPDTC